MSSYRTIPTLIIFTVNVQILMCNILLVNKGINDYLYNILGLKTIWLLY
jgi:hypothetical protein